MGLHESTATLNAMKEGVSKSLEVLADVGGKVQKAALEAEATVRPSEMPMRSNVWSIRWSTIRNDHALSSLKCAD